MWKDELDSLTDGLKPACTDSEILSNHDVCVPNIDMDSKLHKL